MDDDRDQRGAQPDAQKVILVSDKADHIGTPHLYQHLCNVTEVAEIHESDDGGDKKSYAKKDIEKHFGVVRILVDAPAQAKDCQYIVRSTRAAICLLSAYSAAEQTDESRLGSTRTVRELS